VSQENLKALPGGGRTFAGMDGMRAALLDWTAPGGELPDVGRRSDRLRRAGRGSTGTSIRRSSCSRRSPRSAASPTAGTPAWNGGRATSTTSSRSGPSASTGISASGVKVLVNAIIAARGRASDVALQFRSGAVFAFGPSQRITHIHIQRDAREGSVARG
jgi:hypothetical protein